MRSPFRERFAQRAAAESSHNLEPSASADGAASEDEGSAGSSALSGLEPKTLVAGTFIGFVAAALWPRRSGNS